MASRIGARSAIDATRFTATTPHAAAKPAIGASATAASGAAAARSRLPNAPRETPEERVRRLRAAHLAAQNAKVSNMDRVIDQGRRFFDAAHRFTLIGLFGFSVVAGLVTIYSVFDMIRYNKKRRAEFAAAAAKFEAESLEAARLAYIKGTATEEQIHRVEEAHRVAREKGEKLPPLIGPSGAVVDEEQPAQTWKIPEVKKPVEKRTWSQWAFGSMKKEDDGAKRTGRA